MPWIKAEVRKEVSQALKIEAAKRDVRMSDAAGSILEEWYEQSEYDLDGENDGD